MSSSTLLNGLTPQQFMQEYWQKKPLFIRGAMPTFKGLLDANALAGLACDYEMPSRIIRFDPERMMQGESWQVSHGPFDEADFADLPESHWTLLVQGMNHYLPEAEDLLKQFNFIPYARLDDLMVSYAPQGGSVGPHVDSYDVFLLQGSGKRRWQISQQQDLEQIPNAPLRILSNFRCEQEWILEAGDMLYLPPNVAHWGIAEDHQCMTYSIGFRAPARRELAVEFLEECRQAGLADEIYSDPDLLPAADPSAVSSEMVSKVAMMLRQLDWAEDKLGPFLARYFSEPKSYVVFRPNRKLTKEKFKSNISKKGIRLDLQTQMLHWQGQFFINGEFVSLPAETAPLLRLLAVERMLAVDQCGLIDQQALLNWLHVMYQSGYLHCD